jgi:SOS response regulatory protein OraA/RecX
MKKVPKKTAYNKSLDLLSRQDYSKSKLEAKLSSLGHEIEEINAAIRKLEDAKILDDLEYANRKVKSYISKGQGLKLISMNLEKEKILVDDYFVQEIYESLKIDTHQQIQDLIKKKCRYTDIGKFKTDDEIFKFKQKLIRFLTSKGHEFELCQQLAHEYTFNAKRSASVSFDNHLR